MFSVYILQSESTGKYYVGSTDCLEKRLAQHQNGLSPYTSRRGPWRLVFSEGFGTRAEAYNRERQIKSWKSRKAIEDLIGRASR